MIVCRVIQIVLFTHLLVQSFAQNTIGLPDVINYAKGVYNAGSQNWDIKQDKNGVMYFANNEGLLSFDGNFWKTHPVPNRTIVRSVEIGGDNKLYIGAQDDLGFFSPEHNGQLQYHSLRYLIPEKDRSFADVWDIINHEGDIFFRSTNKIYQLNDGRMTVYETPAWLFMGGANGFLMAQDARNELMFFNKGVWAPFLGQNEMPGEFLVTGFLPLNKDSSLIATYKHGLYILSGKKITAFKSPAIDLVSGLHIYSVCNAANQQVAIGTALEGCFIVDQKGQLVQRLARDEGLQNNNILSIFSDAQNNLWMGLDNGIDLVAYNQAIKHIYPQSQNEGSGYASIVYKNQLYIGTSNGLYKAPLSAQQDISFVKSSFEPVENTKGQVWNLSEINGQLLMGHHEGAFVIENAHARLLDKTVGFWQFLPLNNILPSAVIVAGNYQGISFYNYANDQFTPSTINSKFESARFLAISSDNNIWVAHPYKGIYRIQLNGTASPDVKLYHDEDQLNGVNHVTIYKNRLFAATEKGVLEYHPERDSFEVSPFFKTYFGDMSIRYLKEDGSGNIWFVHEKRMGVIDVSGAKPEVIYIPELDRKMVSGFEHIYPLDANNVFIGAEKGFYLLNYQQYRKNRPELRVQIRSVSIRGPGDSLLYGGYFNNVNEMQVQPQDAIREISHKWNSLHFEYSTNLYGNQINMEYSYKLDEFDVGWSDWSKKIEKDYTNLPAGKYTFMLKARNNLGVESAITTYSFSVQPPWYQTIWAYLLYIWLLFMAMYLIHYRQNKKLLLEQVRHAEEQKKLKYLHQLEMEKTEKEIVKLKNEKLEAEIAHKNTELASTAMHLVQKGELLSKVKDDLVKQMRNVNPQTSYDELKRMVKVLGEDDRIDKDWGNFAQHFDAVHSDFLMAVKQVHPNLSPNELKLCAYLRMNLASKEIAPLLNISVRGVEISRYRLRKKLEISTETNLFDYLLGIQGKNGTT
jgi:ligand-binding sensor domain-containing protein/DNA-binding CsgD family transcriptional regulator